MPQAVFVADVIDPLGMAANQSQVWQIRRFEMQNGQKEDGEIKHFQMDCFLARPGRWSKSWSRFRHKDYHESMTSGTERV